MSYVDSPYVGAIVNHNVFDALVNLLLDIDVLFLNLIKDIIFEFEFIDEMTV